MHSSPHKKIVDALIAVCMFGSVSFTVLALFQNSDKKVYFVLDLYITLHLESKIVQLVVTVYHRRTHLDMALSCGCKYLKRNTIDRFLQRNLGIDSPNSQ